MFTPNYPYNPSGQPTLLPTPERTHASAVYTGRGVVIAFLDSGFYPHPDLGDRILIHADATTTRVVEGGRIGLPEEYAWHGEMTSVIAAGDGSTSNGKYRGIASDAQLVLIKVSDKEGHVREAEIVRGLRWLIRNHQRFNVRILNIAVGGKGPSNDPKHPVYVSISKLVEEGVVVLAAAGNSGRRSLVPPACSPDSITVGGINDQNSAERALWLPYPNNYGESYTGDRKPDITAPAQWIAGPILPGSWVEREAHWLGPMLHTKSKRTINKLLRDGYLDLNIPQEQALKPDDEVYAMLQRRIHAHKLIDAHHQYVDGTSVAVAIASSIVAQLLEASPNLTPQQVKAILTGTAKPLPHLSLERQGYGVIDAPAAIAAVVSPSRSQRSKKAK